MVNKNQREHPVRVQTVDEYKKFDTEIIEFIVFISLPAAK